MDLPTSATELDNFLRGESARLGRAIESAEARSARERIDVIDRWLDTLIVQGARLRELGEAAPDALECALREERRRLEQRLSEVPNLRSEATTGSDPQATEAEEAKQAPEVQAAVAATSSSCRLDKTPAGADAPDVLSCDADSEPSMTSQLADLSQRADNLLKFAPAMDSEELQARVQILVAEGRMMQERYSALRDFNCGPGQQMRAYFGRLTRICKEELNERGLFVFGLKLGDVEDWPEFKLDWEERLTELVETRHKHERELHEHQEKERRARQIKDANDRIAGELAAEIRELVATPEDSPEWQIDLRAVVGEAVEYGLTADAATVALLVPHAGVFSSGGEFRTLRRKLRGNDSGASTRIEGVAPPDSRVPAVSAAERWRGHFEGRKGVIVGGSRREYRREKLQEFFGFRSLEWINHERNETADVASLARRIQNGKFDVVFMLARFCSHSLQDHLKPACKRSTTPFARVERGYGAPALARALEACGHYVRGPA